MRSVVVMSGSVGVGKSSFARELKKHFNAERVSTSEWMIKNHNVKNERSALQAAGDRLDKETGGEWVTNAVSDFASKALENSILLVDSVRIPAQINKLREKFDGQVFHIHLHAEDEILKERYLSRAPEHKEFQTYDEVRANNTESFVDDLAKIADLVLDSDHADPRTLAITAMAFHGEIASQPERLVDIVIGGQYGSEGKGNICAHLSKKYSVLMRIGGPNAGHKVKDPEYKFVQLPSGTGSNLQADILIGAGSTLWLPQLIQEISDHNLTPDRLSIDPQAMVIDDEDRRIESGALTSIASTKQGAGSATARKITNRGTKPIFGPAVQLARDVPQIRKYVRNVRGEIDRHLANGKRIMLEGTQGTLLSIHHGFWPSVTSRETSAAGCLSDAGIAPSVVRRVILVVRTYPIRVGGTSGWMGRETTLEAVSKVSGIPMEEFEVTEKGTISGVTRRIAEFDWAQFRRSVLINGATDIAVTFADYLGIDNRLAESFEQLNTGTREFIKRIESVSGAPVTIVSKEFGGVLERGFDRD